MGDARVASAGVELAARPAWRARGLRSALLLLLFLSLSASLTYLHVARGDLDDAATSDVAWYVQISEGVPLAEIPKPFRYRVLTPWLASQVPALPAGLAALYDLTPEKAIAFRFGVVNGVMLALAAFWLAELLGHWRFTPHERLLGGLLFLGSFFVVSYAPLPLVDASSYAFLALALLASVRRQSALLFASVLLGAAARETIFLVALFVPLLQRERRVAVRQLLLVAPALVAYLAFRLVWLPTDVGYRYDPATLLENLAALGGTRRLAWLAIEGVQSFGALWILAALGWRASQAGALLRRAAWVLPVVMAVPLVIGSNIGRVWFLAFPVVIPFALLGLRGVLGSSDPLPPVAASRPEAGARTVSRR